MAKSKTYKVRSVSWKKHQKIATLGGGKKLPLPLSACVTDGERVLLRESEAFVVCKNGLARILPSYFALEKIDLGSIQLELVIKEVTTSEELATYQSLANFHYRDQPLFGRTARLIIQNFHPSYPRTIGYIELATPFYMSKSRTEILNRPFKNGIVDWKTWDKETARKSINLVVRIARCVVYPEFRGFGLGKRLVAHARQFAQERWQVGGLKPQFIEISADMLKYVPFAERAGLHFIGETQGNLARVANDLRYLLENKRRVKSGQIVKQQAFGIVDQQVARLDRAASIMKKNGWSVSQFLGRLRRIEKTSSLHSLSLLQDVLSLPKPTYFGGLNPIADKFVATAVAEVMPKNGFSRSLSTVEPLSAPIRIKKLTLTHSSRVKRSLHTAAVQQAFGISPDNINHQIVSELSFSIEPGKVLMIVGPSGSGKTSLLRFLNKNLVSKKASTNFSAPANARLGTFQPIKSRKPLIEVLGTRDISKALKIMGMVSLSDAFVYLKRYDELSAGQQYRALLARLISGKSNIWMADEFCVNLDTVAASAVASRLGFLARTLKAALIVATPQPELIARSLRPDVVVRLTTAWEHEVLSGHEFISGLMPRALKFGLPILSVDSHVYRRLSLRGVQSALVWNSDAIRLGSTIIRSKSRQAVVSILSIERFELNSLGTAELRAAGFSSRKAVLDYLKKKNVGANLHSTISLLRCQFLN